MQINERIKKLRQEKGMTQKQLAEALGLHQMQISTYERGVHEPSIEMLVKMADLFEVSLDYFVFDNKKGSTARIDIKDRELLRRFEELDKLEDQERDLAKQILDLVITKHHMRELVLVG